jgi:hypothetical protein
MFGLDMSTVHVGAKAILLWVLWQFINSQLPTLMRIICFFTRLGAFSSCYSDYDDPLFLDLCILLVQVKLSTHIPMLFSFSILVT